jgi:hypothetical protein
MVNKKYYFNIFLLIGLAALVYILVKRLINHDTKISIIFNIIDIFLTLGFLLFFNYNHILGMIFTTIWFFLFIIVVIFCTPERLFKTTTFFRLFATIVLIRQVFILDKRSS